MKKKLFIGPRLRRLRRELGLTQARMAEELGVSPSYVNLIERNQRPVSAQLLLRIAQNFDIELKTLASSDDERLFTDLSEAFADPLLQNFGVTREDAHELATGNPAVAEAVAALYRAYRQAKPEGAAASSADRAAQPPLEVVRDFIQAHRNYFPSLEEAGENLYNELKLSDGDPYFAMRRRLEDSHRLRVRVAPADVMTAALRRFDRHRREIMLSEALDASSRNFQLALQIGLLEQNALFDEIISQAKVEDRDVARILRVSLGNYFAAAVMMPYTAFFKAAESLAYDIEALGRRFSASFEQVAHRLTSLQRPGMLGVPFFFIRIDIAGNISKRLSSGDFPFSKFGGACPRWNVHDAFRTPGRILTQVVSLPGGGTFFSIARTVRGWTAGFGSPSMEKAVGVGCSIEHARRLVYARGLDLDAADIATPIGVTCRLCERPDCAQRAFPPAARRLIVDETRRMAAPFTFAFE